MSVMVAWSALLTIAVSLEIVLTIFILRVLRRRGPSSGPTRVARPVPGTRLSVADEWDWSLSMRTQLSQGSALVAFVVPGCLGCQVLRGEFDRLHFSSAPLVVIADQERGGLASREYLAVTWANALMTAIAPAPLETLEEFGRAGRASCDCTRPGRHGHRFRAPPRTFDSIPETE